MSRASRWACAAAPVVPSASGGFHTKITVFPCKYGRAARSRPWGWKRGSESLVVPETPARRAREAGQQAMRRRRFVTGSGELSRRREQKTHLLPRRQEMEGPWASPGHWVGPLCILQRESSSWCAYCGISHHHRCVRSSLKLADTSSRFQFCFSLPSGL